MEESLHIVFDVFDNISNKKRDDEEEEEAQHQPNITN